MNDMSRHGFTAVGRPAPRDSLVDVLDRVLDKGVVIAGDIAVNLLDIELLTVKIRLLIASVDKAKEMGIDWWQRDPQLSGRAGNSDGTRQLEEENRQLRERLERLESKLNLLIGREQSPAPRRARAAKV